MSPCIWTQHDDDEWETWETSCRQQFTLNEGTPKENRMAFCCYCGGALEERVAAEEVAAEEEEDA